MKKLAILLAIILTISIVFAQGQGFTVTSISTTDVLTRTTEPSEVFWIINTQFTGGGQSLIGTIDPSMIKRFMGGEGKPSSKETMTVEVSAVDEQVFYEVINEGVSIYRYGGQFYNAPTGLLGIITDDAQACNPGTDFGIEVGKSFFGKVKRRYCISKVQVATKGVYQNPLIGFNAKIRVSAGGIRKERTICSGAISGCDGSSVSFDDLGVVTWTGSLVTGEPAPNQDNFVAILRRDQNRWQIVRRSTYESYFPLVGTTDSQLTEVRLDKETDLAKVDAKIRAFIEPVNRAADILLAEDTSFTSSPFTKDANTGKVTVTLDRRLTSPNVVFRIRGDWIGIVIPIGQPKIRGINTAKFGSGETGRVDVQVQNVGEGVGTFSASLQGCEPFVQTMTEQTARMTIQPKDVNTFTLFVSGGEISDEVSKDCSVRVYDINDPSIRDVASLTLRMEAAKICIPGQEFVDGNNIKRCNDDGTATEIVEKCEFGVIFKDGRHVCANPPTDKGYTVLPVQRSGCVRLISNGDPSTKIDVAFVGDGYFSDEELRADVRKVVDYDGNSGANGLMSVEPFKSNRDKFNIWMVKAWDRIPADQDGDPDRRKSLEVAAECTAADYQVIMSKKSFRSLAYFSGDAYLSLISRGEHQWGRLLLHEFGHSFGKLADEYVEPQNGNRATSPNCAPDTQTAKKWWANFQDINMHQGCSYVESNIRPYFNTIMRQHTRLEDGYGAVNERALLEILNKYG